MRKLIVGLMVVGLLAVAGSASAQTPLGAADPLGLISTAAISPFWASGDNITFLEVASPVGPNIQGHIVFFTANCTRDESVPLPMTTNDVEVFAVNQFVSFDGLAVIAATLNEIDLVPLESAGGNPIHVRAHWFNIDEDFARVVDPISVRHADLPALTWNPLRSGHTFFAPLEGSTFATTLFLVCPDSNIQSASPGTGGILGTSFGFPVIDIGAASSVNARVYDDDEVIVRDWFTPCDCLTAVPLADISSVYSDPNFVPFGSYTELVNTAGFRFTGYRAVVVSDPGLLGGQIDDFGRLNNADALSLAPTLVSTD